MFSIVSKDVVCVWLKWWLKAGTQLDSSKMTSKSFRQQMDFLVVSLFLSLNKHHPICYISTRSLRQMFQSCVYILFHSVTIQPFISANLRLKQQQQQANNILRKQNTFILRTYIYVVCWTSLYPFYSFIDLRE